MRVGIDKEPFLDWSAGPWVRGRWPGQWIGDGAKFNDEPRVVAFRRTLKVEAETTVRVHVSADERYELYLDGVRIGRGSERGDRHNWFYETYDLKLTAGGHVIVAKVWWLGDQAPYAQHSVKLGFLMVAENAPHELLTTGVARWAYKRLGGISFLPHGDCWGTGARVKIAACDYSWGFESGDGEGWRDAHTAGPAAGAMLTGELAPVWELTHATLPAMMEQDIHVGKVRHIDDAPAQWSRETPVKHEDHQASEVEAWTDLLVSNKPLTIPPNTIRRVIVDLENYFCAYPRLTTSRGRGSSVRILWAESLYERLAREGQNQPDLPKGNRGAVEGKFFHGIGDVFEPDGGMRRSFSTLWWEAGRYVEIHVTTGDEPLVIEDLHLLETHYPYSFEARFSSSDPMLEGIIPVALRTLEMCSHETYMDCPYYEQLQYVGDARLEALTSYAVCRDDRLARKALLMFDQSRYVNGLTQSRYPSRIKQTIPPFSIWWVAMLHDYAMYRNDREFIKSRMPGARAVLEHYRQWIDPADGLLSSPIGWNFMDWSVGWQYGMPAEAHGGKSSILSLQLAMVLEQAAQLEEYCGEPLLARRNRQMAKSLSEAALARFFDADRGLIADDPAKSQFSEHAQILALLGDELTPAVRNTLAEKLLTDRQLTQTTIYFRHYLFETLYRLGRIDRMIDRMDTWFDLRKLDLKTTMEYFEPSRSDCHAWGAHPVYHYFSSILGIRPAGFGFGRVRIAPQMGPLGWARGAMVHPLGMIRVELELKGLHLSAEVTLPEGLEGEFCYKGATRALKSGKQSFEQA